MLFGGLLVIFVGALLVIPGESDSENFCDTILSFDEDVDDICAKQFEKEIRESCSMHEPSLDEDDCLSQVTLLLIDDCVNTEETFGVDKNICMYKKMKNFQDDLEKWLQ